MPWFYLGAILFSLSTWRSEAVGLGHAPPDAWRYGWHRRVFAALQIAEVSLAFLGVMTLFAVTAKYRWSKQLRGWIE